MPEWKTIDSAPEEGQFLGIQMTQGDYFKRQETFSRKEHFHSLPDGGGGIWIGPHGIMPTHWHPLPSPPKET